MIERGNLNAAWKQVKRNKGAAGVDGLDLEHTAALIRNEWDKIKTLLLAGRYRPAPVRRVEIPKPNGGVRRLGVPTILDRFLQQAALQVLGPLFEPHFSEHSYGFRPGRSAHQAVLAAREYQQAGKRWVVDIDLASFFDEVNHDLLMARVRRRVQDVRMLQLIRAFLHSGVMIGGMSQPSEKGTPQGGPLTPWTHLVILSNGLLLGPRGRGDGRRRPSGRRSRRRPGVAAARERDAMAHGDRILLHDDFFDQQADDFLFFDYAEILGRLFQSA
jgi:RNA-directed DNA polymerase